MNAIVEWVQRLAGHGSRQAPPLAYEASDAAERDLPVPDWTWIAMFPGDMPIGLMEILVRSERGHADESDITLPRF
jgi:hypothetical protein